MTRFETIGKMLVLFKAALKLPFASRHKPNVSFVRFGERDVASVVFDDMHIYYLPEYGWLVHENPGVEWPARQFGEWDDALRWVYDNSLHHIFVGACREAEKQ